MRSPVWGDATLALTGLYFGDPSAKIEAAFGRALADRSIEDRLRAPVDRRLQLAGDPWFYYGTRYGLFLKLNDHPTHDPEDFLPAVLEQASSNPGSYQLLAQAYLDGHEPEAAIAEYRHVLELNPQDPSPLLTIARVQFAAGKSDIALATYREALGKLRTMIDMGVVPEEFWQTFAGICADARDGSFAETLRPEMNVVLAAYIRKNGEYRSMELLRSAFLSLGGKSQDEAVRWVMQLIVETKPDDQASLLEDLTGAQDWYPKSLLGDVYAREISLAIEVQQRTPHTSGPTGGNGADAETESGGNVDEVTLIREGYVRWLLANGKADEAQREFDSVPAVQRSSDAWQRLELFLAARQSRLGQVLEKFASDPEHAPALDVLSNVANSLRLRGDALDNRLLLEFIFQRKLDSEELEAADFLSLAEARLDTNDVPGALDLLHRLALSGDFYENLDSAASLLERTGHFAEALPMLKKLSVATPWSPELRLRLAEAEAVQRSSDAELNLADVAGSPQSPYATRAAAAIALEPMGGSKHFDSGELTSLASATVTIQQARRPYFVYAPLMAAKTVAPGEARSLLEFAIAAAPDSMRPWLRLQIFRAEMTQGAFERAEVAIEPVLTEASWIRSVQPATTDEESSDDAGEFSDSSLPAAADGETPYGVASALSRPEQRLPFLRALATMHERLNDTSMAKVDLEAAIALMSDAGAKHALQAEVHELDEQDALAAMNASRRPAIGESVEQSVTVRPRLTSAVGLNRGLEVVQ